MSFINEFQHLKISLKDIKSATNYFGDNNCIGRGGFGKVYKGELNLYGTLTMVAIKRLDRALGQGAIEFWKEIMLLSRYKHENLVSLLGFCDENGENILVYEYLSNKSLDLYLSDTDDLNWNQRLRICIGVAHGLQYLHDPLMETPQQRILHRDIKSANILLDENWNPKISDFGLSKISLANQQFTFLFSNTVGTIGYCDPLYVKTGYLTKESDIYSFGAVLFEVLCGRHCVQNYNDIRSFLTVLAPKRYEEKKLDTIINESLKQQISPECLERFSKIAYQCLREKRSERPSITKVVKELEIALQSQAEQEFQKVEVLNTDVVLEADSDVNLEGKLPKDWEVIIKMFNIAPAIYTSKKKLLSFLQEGILFDDRNQFFWINNDEKKCVLISARRFLNLDGGYNHVWVFQQDYLRFSRVVEYCYGQWHSIKCQIKTSMLSPGTMYTASLVFKLDKKSFEYHEHLKLVMIKWKTEGLSVSSIHNAVMTPDNNWYKIRMWRFISHGPNADFDIALEALSSVDHDREFYNLLIQGIEFQPTEMHEDIERSKNLPISDEDDEYWENKLPSNYQHYIDTSNKPLYYNSKKELYFLLCAGFLGGYGRLWFSLCKSTGGICCMLPAGDILLDYHNRKHIDTLSLSGSRFGEVKKLRKVNYLIFKCKLWPHMFSAQHSYVCYLVFKFEDNHLRTNDARLFGVEYVLDFNHQGRNYVHLNAFSKNIPIIEPKIGYRLDDESNIPRFEGPEMPKGRMVHIDDNWMEERNDGWMEVLLGKPLQTLLDHNILEVRLYESKAGDFNGLIMEGIEFRPAT